MACALASCGSGSSEAGPDSSTGPVAKTVATTLPSSTCVRFVPEAPCGKFVSTSAKDGTAELLWAAGSVEVSLEDDGSGPQLVVKAPGNPINAPLSISNHMARLNGDVTVGAAGCIGDASDQQAWMESFVRSPFAVSYKEGVLSWSQDTRTINFKLVQQ